MTEKKPDDLERVIAFAKDLASPDWCLSVPVAAKTVITNLIAAVEKLKPRTIETVEEVRELREGAVLMSGDRYRMYDGVLWRISGGMIVRVGREKEGVIPFGLFVDPLPATVLYEPGAGE